MTILISTDGSDPMAVRVTFEADTPDELMALVRHWVSSRGAADADAVEAPMASQKTYTALVIGVRGEGSRRFLREVAEASARGEAVPLDDALLARYGREKPVAMAGIASGTNRRSKRLTGRLLITRDEDGFRMSPSDAKGVLAAFGAAGGPQGAQRR